MSNADPNNPYAKQGQPQSQDPYAQNPYAQQPYAYPQAPPLSDPYGNMLAPPLTSMPGKVKATRIMMFIAGGLQSALCALLLVGLAVATEDFKDGFSDGAGVEIPTAVLAVFLIVYLIHAIIAIVLASLFGKGAGGVRVSSIIWSSFIILIGLISIPIGVLWMALGIICIVFLAGSDGGDWFKRPRS